MIGGFWPVADRARVSLTRDAGLRLWTPSSHLVALSPGNTVHYRDEGSSGGAPLVVLHGVNDSLLTFEPWVRALGTAFRLISVDLPGHGLTGPLPGYPYTPDALDRFVADFTTHLGLGRFVLAGNSLGGGLAWRFAIAHPGRTLGLILLAPTGLPPRCESSPGWFARAAHVPMARKVLASLPPDFVIRAGLERAFGDRARVPADLVRRMSALLLMAGNREAALARLAVPWTYPLIERIGELAMPILLIWGENDRLLPPDDYVARFAAAWPQAQILRLAGIGHLPQLEAAEETAEAVQVFLSANLATPGAVN